MKIFMSVYIIIILIFLCAILENKAQEDCEKTNGKWVVINGAGFNNTSYKCVR